MSHLLGLKPGESRSGVDAYFEFKADGLSYSTPVELKSTTKESVSTARDVGPAHIEKWRSRAWVFGFYNETGTNLETILLLGPQDMEPWIAEKERYIAPDLAIGERVAQRLTINDLYEICGEKCVYDYMDARSLQKRQWRKAQYVAEMDEDNGYSAGKMLDVLRLRARYLNARGATLNNPHIPKRFFAQFHNRALDHRTLGETRLRSRIRRGLRSLTLESPQLRSIAERFAIDQASNKGPEGGE